jgi:hypothetical protein
MTATLIAILAWCAVSFTIGGLMIWLRLGSHGAEPITGSPAIRLKLEQQPKFTEAHKALASK